MLDIRRFGFKYGIAAVLAFWFGYLYSPAFTGYPILKQMPGARSFFGSLTVAGVVWAVSFTTRLIDKNPWRVRGVRAAALLPMLHSFALTTALAAWYGNYPAWILAGFVCIVLVPYLITLLRTVRRAGFPWGAIVPVYVPQGLLMWIAIILAIFFG